MGELSARDRAIELLPNLKVESVGGSADARGVIVDAVAAALGIGFTEDGDIDLPFVEDFHWVDITETGYGLAHPALCRADGRSLLDCPLQEVAAAWTRAPAPVGRYLVDDDGVLHLDAGWNEPPSGHFLLPANADD